MPVVSRSKGAKAIRRAKADAVQADLQEAREKQSRKAKRRAKYARRA